jgi:uncharacterized protein
LVGDDRPNKPANGVGVTARLTSGQGPRSGDVLFERGLYWASRRSGVVNLIAAHKWFNLAALKGRTDAIPLRREVAEMMSEVEIAMAQREARAWMTAS